MAKTQERLATGLKVNSALDNPTNFFTAAALNSRAGDMANLLNSMSSGIKTIEAADNGLSSIVKTVETMQSTLRQARQDKSFKSQSYTIPTNPDGTLSASGTLRFSGGAFGATTPSIDLTEAAVGGVTAVGVDAAGSGATFGAGGTVVGGTLTINGRAISVAADADLGTVVNAINGETGRTGVTAADDGTGQLQLTNITGENITITGSSTGFLDGIGLVDNGGEHQPHRHERHHRRRHGCRSAAPAAATRSTSWSRRSTTPTAPRSGRRTTTASSASRTSRPRTCRSTASRALPSPAIRANNDTIGRNDVRRNLVTQFNDLRDQLDKFSDDASFNGINLLRGDKLKLTFNETGTSTIEIEAKDEVGQPHGDQQRGLGIALADASDFDSDGNLDSRLDALKKALGLAAVPRLLVRLEPLGRPEPHRLHQEDDQHPRDRRGEPHARRHQRGSREPAGAADPPAAQLDGPLHGLAGRPGRAAPVRLSIATSIKERRASARLFICAPLYCSGTAGNAPLTL